MPSGCVYRDDARRRVTRRARRTRSSAQMCDQVRVAALTVLRVRLDELEEVGQDALRILDLWPVTDVVAE